MKSMVDAHRAEYVLQASSTFESYEDPQISGQMQIGKYKF